LGLYPNIIITMTEEQEKRRNAVMTVAELIVEKGVWTYVNIDTWEVQHRFENEDYFFERDPRTERKNNEVREIIRTWKRKFTFRPMNSSESYRIMKEFIENQLPAGEFQDIMKQILVGPKPFADFNHKIHVSEFKNAWFEYKKNYLEQYVKTLFVTQLNGGAPCTKEDLETFYPSAVAPAE
jgi:hypothetical protein